MKQRAHCFLVAVILFAAACKDKRKSPAQPLTPDMQLQVADLHGSWIALALNRLCLASYDFEPSHRYKATLRCNNGGGLQSEITEGSYSLAEGQLLLVPESSTCREAKFGRTPQTVGVARRENILLVGSEANAFKRISAEQLNTFLAKLGEASSNGCFQDGYLAEFEGK
jgi:hypothetical protein